MAVTPYRVRVTQPGAAPGWLRTGTGERMLQTFGLMIDCRMERLAQGMLAHMPRGTVAGTATNPITTLRMAPYDAQLVIAGDRLLVPGLNESRASLAYRNQHAFETWQLAGLPRAVLSNALAYVLGMTPMARTVATKYDRSTWPPTRVSSVWATYAAGDDTTLAPVPTYAINGGNGDWDWDSLSPITGSWGWWQAYLVIYSVAPNDWAGDAQVWGQGSTYTPSGDGYYSTGGTTGGLPSYVASGSYSGTTRAWGAGMQYTPSADGYYSTGGTVDGLPSYVPSGGYNGAANGWGVAVSFTVGEALVQIARQFKPANVWWRSIVVSRDMSLFDPSQPAGGGINPDGYFGQWSKGGTVGGLPAYVASRFAAAVYGGEVV